MKFQLIYLHGFIVKHQTSGFLFMETSPSFTRSSPSKGVPMFPLYIHVRLAFVSFPSVRLTFSFFFFEIKKYICVLTFASLRLLCIDYEIAMRRKRTAVCIGKANCAANVFYLVILALKK